MNNKTKISRLQCKKDTKITSENEEKKSVDTTPVRKSLNRDDIEDEKVSPFFMRFTQDSGEDEQDVIWDWDSPRSKTTHNFHRKRILHSSPKLPNKQITINKNLPRFNSLKAELEQLATKLEDEDVFVKPNTPENDLFDDDSLDEEMIKCSQKVEEAHNLNTWCSSIINNNKHLIDTDIQDDSFDMFLEECKEEDIEKLSQTTFPKPFASPRAISRTNSAPNNFFPKANLQSRTKSEDINHKHTSPIKCSPEEIEKKRQEAKEKLEFKKKQHEIERKRLEALERLKRNKMMKMLNGR